MMLLIIAGSASAQVTVSGSTGANSTYTTLKAAFDALNANGNQSGNNITISITASTTEVASASLNQSSVTPWTSLTISPSGGAMRTVSGSLAGGALINLNGADNVVIDGLNSGGNGLTIENTSTSATAGTSTIRFINDAGNNTVQNCTIKGSGTSATNGTVFYSTGTTTGNDNNTLTGNIISPSGLNLPVNALYSAGTSVSADNSGNTVSNNDIQDYFGAAISSNGILIASNSSAWTITGNKFFQSATRTATAAVTHRAIQIVTALGVGYTVSNNTIGYANNGGTGVTTYNGAFGTLYRGIEMTVGIASSSSVQGNTVSGISFSTTSGTTTLPGIFSGIAVLAGSVDIGTSSPNTIGAATGTGSISITSTTSLGVITGIYAVTLGTTAVEDNIIGSISTGGAAAIGYTFHGIYTAGVLGNIAVNGNTIGSTATAHSIAVGTSGVTTSGVCTFNGIANAATGTVTISGNTVQNVTAYGTGASVFNGIINSGGTGTLTITANSIISGTITGTGALIGISNSAAPLTLNMNSNIVRNIVRTISGTFTALQNTGVVTTAVNINNNQLGNVSGGLISYSIATASALIGINNTGGATGASLSISGNDIRGISHTAASTQTHTYISNTAATLSQAINNNTFTALNVNTTGAIVMISNNVIVQGSGTQEVNGNAVVTSFTRNAASASGALTLFASTASSLTGAVITNNDNDFSNITVSGAATIAGWSNTDAGNPTKRLQNNTFSNWTGGTGAITAMTVNLTGSNNSTSGNTISSISSAGNIIGITTGAGNDSIYQNTIHTLVSTGGTATTVVGISVTAGTVKSIYRNTIYNLQANNITTGSVVGIAVSAGTTNHLYRNKIYDLSSSSAGITTGYISGILVSGATASLVTNISNNTIGTLQATAGSGTNLVQGINLLSSGATSSINVYYNTVYLNGSSSGTNYGTSGLYHAVNTTAATAKLDLRNNIIVNISTPAGSGTTVAYRRSLGTSGRLANYASTSNNNLFYAGTPGATRLIYADGTSTAQTIAAYTGGVFTAGTIAPRDAASVSEAPNWVSTTGSSSDFLHIDTGIATQIESGGAAIASYDNDIDDNIRQGSFGYPGSGTAPDIGADEFNGIAVLIYYSKATGFLNVLSTWGTATNGSGSAPANFTANNMMFNIRNNATPTLNAAWDVTGSGSTIVVGNGVAACNFTIPSGFALNGTVDVSNNATLTVQNTTVPAIGTLATGSTVVFSSTGSQTIPAEDYHHLTSSSTGARILQNSGTIGIAGTFTPGSNVYTVTGSTVEFKGSGAQTIPAFSYNNLTSSSTGARTLAGAGTIGIAGAFTPGSNSYTVTGSTVDFNGGGAQTIPAFSYHHLTSSSSGSRALDAGGTIAIAGTFTKGTNSYSITGGTVDYNGTAAQNVVGLSYNHLTISGIGISTLQATSSIGGDLLISGGTFDLGAFTADRSAPGGSFTIAAGCTLRIGGNGTTLPANYTATSFAPTAVIEYYGTNQTIPGGTYENLNIAGSGITVTLSSNVSVVGDLTVIGGTLDLGTFTANRTAPGGTLNIGTSGTLKIGGTNNVPENYSIYSFDPTSTVEYSGTKQTVDAFDYGSLTISASDTVTLPNGGTVRISGTFTPGAGPFVTTGSIIEYNSAGAQTVALFTYHDLILSTGGTKTFAAGTTGIAGALTVSGATADAVANTATIEYNGTSAQTIAAITYYDLTITNGGTKSILGPVTVDHDLLANSGTVTIIDASGSLTIHGDLDNSGILTIDGTLDLVP